MKVHKALTLLVAVALGGCVTTSIPAGKDYSGPTATLRDSSEVPAKTNCGSFFVLREYDGKLVDNALVASARANEGMGPVMAAPHPFSRPIPVRDAAFHISAQTHCAAPIQELMGTTYIVHGVVHFTPEADNVYVITGELGPERGAVWVKNENTGAQVGNKLLIEGAPKASKWDGAMTGHLTELPPTP
jgi:hypothetical protein